MGEGWAGSWFVLPLFLFPSAFSSVWCFWVFLSFLVNVSSQNPRHVSWAFLRTFTNLILVHWHETKLFRNSASIKARERGANPPFLQKTLVSVSASRGMSRSHNSLGGVGNIYPLIFMQRPTNYYRWGFILLNKPQSFVDMGRTGWQPFAISRQSLESEVWQLLGCFL